MSPVHICSTFRSFILSEGNKYQSLQITSKDIHPQKAPGSPENGLDGWSYMMRTPEKDFALLYFENQSLLPELIGFKPSMLYTMQWFNPTNGKWGKKIAIKTDKIGRVILSVFPDDQSKSVIDWAVKIIENR